ncbi:hypothetical protein [Arthrobacter sp. ISL-30]|uniref:hypothetical protein n=1 Tax=Arthrobacter sp. ISL-30 TaxID=2819109 RepID=UPI001BED33B6|nr:hypothetical protein [Arthrobacter sp. ISL-30]MBT2514669.1 hypothetical protein [Arthrobacter sp. ISL-30]
MPDDALDDVQHEDVRKGSLGMLFSKEYWRSTLFISGFQVLRPDTVLCDPYLR